MAEQYGEDLAYIHDVGFRGFTMNAAPVVMQSLRVSGVDHGLIVDLGCGTGLWADLLLRAGYDVLGVDISPGMVAVAKKRAPDAKFLCESFLDTKIPTCDAVTSIGECFNYQFDRESNEANLRRLFARIYYALRPGGVFLFDIRLPPSGRTKSTQLSHRQGEDWAVLGRVELDETGSEMTRTMTTFRKVGKMYRRNEEVHRLRLYPEASIEEKLTGVGFEVRSLRGYGGKKFAVHHLAFIARKKS